MGLKLDVFGFGSVWKEVLASLPCKIYLWQQVSGIVVLSINFYMIWFCRRKYFAYYPLSLSVYVIIQMGIGDKDSRVVPSFVSTVENLKMKNQLKFYISRASYTKLQKGFDLA